MNDDYCHYCGGNIPRRVRMGGKLFILPEDCRFIKYEKHDGEIRILMSNDQQEWKEAEEVHER